MDDALKTQTEAYARESKEIEFQASVIGLTSEARAKAIESRKIEIDLEEQLREIREKSKGLNDGGAWRAEQEAKAHENFLKKRKNLDDKYDLEYNQKMVDGISDAVYTGLIEGGKAGKKKLRDLIVETAEKNMIPFQRAALSRATGTDTDAFAYSNGGVPSALISLPLRYMHTTVEMVHREDVENVIKLIFETLLKIKDGETFIYFE